MKKIIVISLFFTLVFAVSAQTGTLHTDADISMRIPAGWQPMNFGLKYAALVGPEDSGFTPNFTIVEEAYSGALSEYLDASLTVLTNYFANFQLLQRGNFSTSSGLQGMYLIIQGSMNNITVWQKLYVFQNRNRTDVIIVNGTAGVNQGKKYEPIFDECVKTFTWSR